MGQQSGRGLPGASASASHWPRSSQGPSRKGSMFQAQTRVVVGRIQFLMSCWAEPSIPHEASLGSLPRGPLHRASHTWWLASSGEQADGQERVLARERAQAAVFCKLILEVRYHHFSYILLVARSNLHSKGGDYTRVCVPGGGTHWELYQKLPITNNK